MTGIRWDTRLVAIVAMLVGASTALADTTVYDLVTPNSDLTSFQGPFLQVTVNRTDTTHATITFDSLTNGGYQYLLTGAAGSAVPSAFANVSGTFSLASFSGTLFSGSASALSNGGSGSINAFGTFDETIKIKDNLLTDAYTEIVMTLTATSGNSWANAASVLTSNGDTQILAAHVGALAQGGTAFKQTGFVSGALTAPEPSTRAIAGLGALGFIAFGLRRLQKTRPQAAI